MTPARIRIRILKAQMDELRLIVTELKATPPANMNELVAACCEVRDEVASALTALDRAAVATDAQSDGDV